MAAGLGLVAARRRWRLAMLVIAASYFGVGTLGAADQADPGRAALRPDRRGGGLYVGLRERWWETRLLTFTGGWALLAAAGERIPQHWAVLAAGVVLSLPVWWHGLRRPQIFPLRLGPQRGRGGWSAGGGALLLRHAHAARLGRVRSRARPVRRHPGLAPLIVAVPYVIAGYQRLRPAFALVGAAAMGRGRGGALGADRRSGRCWPSRCCGPSLDLQSRPHRRPLVRPR